VASKGHAPVSEGAEWASEGRLLLVLGINRHLIIPEVPIKETVVALANKTLEDLINE